MIDDSFRLDNAWRPPAEGSYAFLEVGGDKARMHFRIGDGSARATDWLALDSARARALEIARLEGLALPLVERDEPEPEGAV